ncbi:MAG: flavin reductase family protein [Candidatus Thermoplasmatota archaeon]|nr:flavin reductase family protein [Candidatus Thermoplasmatota archaeon]
MSKKEVTVEESKGLFPAFPVALITAGENVASYGLVHIFSFTPMLIGVGVRRSRHTYDMIKKTGDFGVNLPGKDLVDAVNVCGTKSGRDVDKFEACGLTKVPGSKIKSVLVGECPINIECALHRIIEMPDSTHDWFLGEVVAARMDDGGKAEDALLYWNAKYRLVGEEIGKRG